MQASAIFEAAVEAEKRHRQGAFGLDGDGAADRDKLVVRLVKDGSCHLAL